MIEWIGWLATAVFVCSYLVRDPSALLRLQMGAAALWIIYGWGNKAGPVVVANTAVALAAAFSLWRRRAPSDVERS